MEGEDNEDRGGGSLHEVLRASLERVTNGFGSREVPVVQRVFTSNVKIPYTG